MQSIGIAHAGQPAQTAAREIAQLQPDAVYDALDSRPQGLSSAEAAERLSRYGSNQYVTRRRLQAWLRPLVVAIRPLLLPLWIAAIVAYSLGEVQTAVLITAAALLNTLAGAWQERKAEHATAALREALPGYAHILRDGHDYHVVASQVVPGDVLLLSSGEIVPADARVVEEHDLRTANVALLGETAAARKVTSRVMGEDLLAIELPNVVYAGGRVASGSGRAVVFATGVQTAYGAIAALTDTAHEEPSPLLWVFVRLGFVVMALAALAALAGGAFAGMSAGFDRPEILLLAVALLVAASPAGLMPGITVALLEGTRRMAAAGAAVRRLSSVETLGATTVICADKTGTLTQNELTVREIWTVEGRVTVTGIGFKPSGGFFDGGKALDQPAVQRRAGGILRAALLTSDARLLPPDTLRPHWHILGDPAEAALIVAAAKAGYHAEELYDSVPEVVVLPPVDALPLEGRVVDEHGRFIAYLKGSPAVLVPRCTMIATAGGPRPLSEHDRQALRRTIRRFDREAMRTAAFASRRLPSEAAHDVPRTEHVAHELVLLGLVAVVDPPRQEVEEAIRTCHRAGIRTMMLTGDYALSAESIARRCALVESTRATVITGIELGELNDDDLRERLRIGDIVFARMTPEHKVRVVQLLDEMGEVVLVTGGAANDVPAIKAASIGVAMGTSTSPAAREAADVVLEQDNFATVATAILEGRAVEQRARRLVALNLGVTTVKLGAFAAGFLLGWPLLLSVGQLLLIDLLAGLLPAVALGVHPPDPELMRRPPRTSGRALIDARVYKLGYAWFGLIGLVGALAGALLAIAALDLPPGPTVLSQASPLFHGEGVGEYLVVSTAYIVLGIAALAGAGMRLRASMWRHHVGLALIALVLIMAVATIVAVSRTRTLQTTVVLATVPGWLWAGAAVALTGGALLEWGRQKVERLPPR